MKPHLLLTSLVLFSLAGCIPTNNLPELQTIPSLPSPSLTSTAEVLVTPTNLPSQTSNQRAMTYQCLEIIDNLPPDKLPQGELIFKDEKNSEAFILDMKKGVEIKLPKGEGNRFSSFDVSPDGQHLVFQTGELDSPINNTVMTNVDGVPIWTNKEGPYTWFDNEWLFSLEQPILKLENPFTGETKELIPNFPNIRMFTGYSEVKWRGTNGLPVYNPSLTQVVYPECDSDCEDQLVQGIPQYPVVLWDIQTNQALARLITTNEYGGTPIWLPDGSRFVMSADIQEMDSYDSRMPYYYAQEFFVIKNDGQILQLTDFLKEYTNVQIVDSYTVSPDGNMVAFWIIAEPSQFPDARLAILNINTKEVINFCLEGSPFMEASLPTSILPPIWSPDSSQLVIVDSDPKYENRRRTVLVDINRSFAEVIYENYEPVGWMRSP